MNPVDALSRYPLFALMGQRALAAWIAAAQDLSIETGQRLTRAGQQGEFAYLVLQGRIRLLSHGRSREVALGAVGPGEAFGEYALLPPHLDTATSRAIEPGRVLRLPLAGLRATIAGRSGVGELLKNWLRLHAISAHLRGGAFLGFLSAPSVLSFLDRCVEERHPVGHTVQAPGLCDDSWFFVRSGHVLLRQQEGQGQPRLLGPGDCFGERGLYGRGRLPQAEVVQEATLLRLQRDEFARGLTAEAPTLCQTLNPTRGVAPAAIEWVPQRGPADCGAAALAMAARQAGLSVTLEQVAGLLPTADWGVSLDDLAGAAGRLGLSATAARVAPSLLGRVRPPAVAHLGRGHYVAVLANGLEDLMIGDPALGVATMRTQDVARAWSGAVLLLDPPG